MPRKGDADAIEELLSDLPAQLGLSSRKAPWPRFIYRFDDIRTVAHILRKGRLLSRTKCHEEGITFHDAANKEIIQQTQYLHGYVRLYFRPLTPTQYKMEGIRAKKQMTPTGEHCPVPVFLLFDSKQLLTEQGVSFTDGSPTRKGKYTVGDSAEFLAQLPFESIYHEGTIYGDRDEISEIIFRRHAEVLVPGELDLTHLRHIVCRTGPERDTLLFLLGDAASKWSDRIRIARAGDALFYTNGVYVEDIRLVGDKLNIKFPPRAYKYDAELIVSNASTGKEIVRRQHAATSLSGWRVLDLPLRIDNAIVELTIEGVLAYKGSVSQDAVFG